MKRITFYLILLISILSCKGEMKAEQANAIINQSIKSKTMQDENFTSTILVDQSPKEAFDAINNVRGWWSEDIEGGTSQLNDVFIYHYKDVHYCKVKIIEVVPNKRVVWHVLDNHFDFTKDKTEWIDTRIIFDISEKDGKTQVRFTHVGLVPVYECYEICNDAWTNYIQNSLRGLITTGKGQPNTKEHEVNAELLKRWKARQNTNKQDFTVSYLVDKSPKEVFNAINDITLWWSDDFKGNSHKLNDEFEVTFFGDVHYSKQKLIEVIPNQKVVWLVTDSQLNFLKDKSEWTGTTISFDIAEKDGKTEILFVHHGLNPQIECYGDCTKGWAYYLGESLLPLITTGKGQPTTK